MKDFGADIKKIFYEERLMFILVIINILAATALLIFSLINLNPNVAVVKVGYGDIGGYRSGSWYDMLAFAILAIVFGIFHNIIAVRIYKKRGAGMAKFFIITTTALIAGTFVVLLRLLEKV